MAERAKIAVEEVEPDGQGRDSKNQSGKSGQSQVTPMMAQYLEIKAANQDCLLFYRMGDFYELFFDDAYVAAEALGITLTKRGKHSGEDIAMCGVPVHAAEGYLHRLIDLGHRVAVCEQMEDPAEAKKRGSKSVVQRGVVRLVTPGTLTEESLLNAKANNFLTSVCRARAEKSDGEDLFALASVDISTGEFLVSLLGRVDLAGELVRLSPGELLVGDKLFVDDMLRAVAEQAGSALTPVPDAYFDSQLGERQLKQFLGVSHIGGLGELSRGELSAIGGVLKYIDITQLGQKPALRAPRRSGPQSVLVIDGATRISLELIKTSSGDRKGSLLAAMDRTLTGAGGRELAGRLASPLVDISLISERLDCVDYFCGQTRLRDQLRDLLKGLPDVARALSRLSLGRGSPRDLGALRDGLRAAEDIAALMVPQSDLVGLPQALDVLGEALRKPPGDFVDQLARGLEDDLPVQKRDGGFVRIGYRPELDENRKLRDQGRQVLADLQARYSEKTGIKSLKVKHNNVLGYFVEVTAANGALLMDGADGQEFVHRQTLANAVRFSTAELSETESKILKAAERALAIELEVFSELCSRAEELAEILTDVGEALAALDVYAGLSVLAEEQNYTRPDVNGGSAFDVSGGRHPVVEQALVRSGDGPFIENDCLLGGDGESQAQRIMVLTGPNMAGKSTYLRQNALIAIMAQMGSFVPAQSAKIGVVDRLFSRVGASDDLARGRSTFMVEMVETANILNQATERSLVILDEIGRGTATYDGLSIAWAAVEYLHDANRCRALFATHYHELTALAKKLDFAANATIEVKDWKDEIVFLHKVVPGAADRSYGIQVAKLAGLPGEVISRASEVLQLLEASGDKSSPEQLIDDLPLFAATRPKSVGPSGAAADQQSEIEKALEGMQPDEMTPREALDALYELKSFQRKT